MMLPSKQKAFTLIELLVVMTIGITAAGLVGGLTVDYMDKYKRHAEIKRLEDLVGKVKRLAYVTESPLKIHISSRSVRVANNNKSLGTETFEKLSFEPTVVDVSAFGHPSKMTLDYYVDDRRYQFNLQLSGHE